MPRPQLNEIRKPLDIILHKERPQKSSSYVPRFRDWRYATGVFRHEDNLELPGGTTCWDDLDEDYMNGVFGKERRKVKGWNKLEQAVSKITEDIRDQTPEGMEHASPQIAESLLANGQLLTPAPTPKKRASSAKIPKNRAFSVVQFAMVDPTADDEQVEWKAVSLVVKLRFPYKRTDLQGVLDAPPKPNLELTPPITPCSARSVDTIRTYEPFEPEWVDETQEFDLKKLFASLRWQSKHIEDIPPSFVWFPEAVPVDAIFPPRVPMSIKEILAYYPHHLRWKGVALRHLNNGYRGPEIVDILAWFRGKDQPPFSGRVLHEHFRALFRGTIRDFNITKWAGKPDSNLYTDHFESNRTVERRGHCVPTFEELLSGLKYFPTGIHARGLTQCLIWYLNNRNMFSPPLQFNVLHTQALLRVLQIPVKNPGHRNLDMVALQEWKDHAKFTEKEVDGEKKTCDTSDKLIPEHDPGPKIILNMEQESVSLKLDVKLRHILTLPYMAIGNMSCELLRWGIEDIEQRQKERDNGLADTESEEAVDEDVLEPQSLDEQAVGWIGKRTLDVDEADPDRPAKKQAMLLKQVLYSKAQGLVSASSSEVFGD
ncbi:hypothetical protein K491DRAFT_782049 [Lophiostoma macrostomum CBS 122681]|uniref:Uncharacterized protein n=1 Tax=Lophiostoma macrostomum CBS 122681 TaxID=1314788 RepID=A0A6A6SVV0_9PLEO|nr:hypothetical protein K491DRAFT_782049 [Lophiostoma macrostomum CBS 122681]